MAYNSKMEWVYNGEPIKDSNIISLIEHAVNIDKQHHGKVLKGIHRFYRMLNRLHISETLYHKLL